MINVKELVGSMINSFLGPNKSNKLVVQDKDIYVTRCPLHIFQNSHIQDPLSSLVEDTLFAHHELYGCSTLSLLAMWHLWWEEFSLALEEGCEMQDIILCSQDILELVISSLSDLTISIDSLLIFKKHSFKKIIKGVSLKKSNVFAQIPISIQYSSRHFSPSSQNSLNFADENGKCDKKSSELDESCLKTIIQRLDHDEDIELSDLILECWKNQITASNFSSKFQTDGLLICPIILPCSYSTVLDGLVIKSNLNHTCYQNMKNADSNRTLIIKGSITYDHVHLGFSPKVLISAYMTSDTPPISEKEKWRKKCCELIIQFNINVLLIRGDIDTEVANFCSAHSVLVFSHIPLKVLKVLCQALQYSPCTYLWDCNKESIIQKLCIKEWKVNDSIHCNYQYFLFNVPGDNMTPLQTIVLCHPSQAVLEKKKHQVWHLASRLSLCFQSKKLLPGGEVEEWCSEFLKKCPQFQKPLDPKNRISIAVANGYQNYSNIVSRKKALFSNTSKMLDEMSSKLSAWRSAMSLVLLTLQCDTAIINGTDDLTVKESMNLSVNNTL